MHIDDRRADLVRAGRQCTQAQQAPEQQSECIMNRRLAGRVKIQKIHRLENPCKRLEVKSSGAPETCSCVCPVKEASFTDGFAPGTSAIHGGRLTCCACLRYSGGVRYGPPL